MLRSHLTAESVFGSGSNRLEHGANVLNARLARV